MSEEILRALMTLFAIVAKQDQSNEESKKEFVTVFLKSQLTSDKVDEYIALYDEYLQDGKEKFQQALLKAKEKAEKKGIPFDEKEQAGQISVKDSVKTLGICKKINKTLTQRQKIVVLVRLLEFIKTSSESTEQSKELLDTVSDVFNVTPEEYHLIEHFINLDDLTSFNSESLLTIHDEILIEELNSDATDNSPENDEIKSKRIISDSLNGTIAIIQVESVNLYFLRYTGTSEIFLNGLTVNNQTIYLFAQGATIRLPRGTVYYSDVISRFLHDDSEEVITFKAKINEHKFPNGTIALRNVEINEKSGTLVGLMGASGAGKTTLLNILSGQEIASNGKISVNGVDLNENYDEIKGSIGYIPQDDLLIEELSVYQNLYYNAKLCFKDLSDEEIKEKVENTLKDLGLYAIRDVKVGNVLKKLISGGQRKRLNIALELIREPAILFVDEPTSGLSSRDSENVMDLLKELSLKGRLIYVVIHQPSSDIYKMFDRLILLDTGGYPIYYGNPVEAIIYFKTATNQINSDTGECGTCGNVNPELLFNIIEAKVVDEYGNYLQDRKMNPDKWHELYQQEITPNTVEETKEPITKKLKLPSKLEQLKVFITRDVLSKIGNKQYLFINLLEAPALAFILSFIIRYTVDGNDEYYFMFNENVAAYLFMSIVVALFIGLTVSAEEIFKDLKILKRESFLNLSRGSYLTSKISILFFVSAIQSLLFVTVGNSIVGINGMLWEYWLVFFSVTCFANVLGLNISASFNSAVTIYILIPLFIIPQMILGGALFSFDRLNKNIGGGHTVPIIADVMASRWAFEALMVQQYKANTFQKRLYPLEKKLSEANYRMVYFVPKIEELMDLTFKAVENADLQKASNNFEIVKNELTPQFVRFEMDESLSLLNTIDTKSFDSDELQEVSNAIEDLNSFYVQLFTKAEKAKEKYLAPFLNDEERAIKYELIKRRYFNENISDLVTASTKKSKILLEDNKLVQVIDPIYLDPTPINAIDYRSHFYAPKKHFAGSFFNTFYFNVTVIWVMTALLFVSLYFNLFKRMLNFFGNLRK